MKKKIFTSIGLMSGTSMDGIDLSIIKSDGYNEFSPILNTYFEFDNELYQKLISLREKTLNLDDLDKNSDELSSAEKKFTLFNGQIVNEVIKNYGEKIDLIGFHGQTIFHSPSAKISKQLGDGDLLSSITKNIVINNFRQNDINHGGQGAPLTPIFHNLISKILNKKFKIELPMSIVNIGGITNITQIKNVSNESYKNIFAYDVAPGNCLIDKWVRKNTGTKFDKDGYYAKTGTVNELFLNQAIDNFEIKSFDKSLDIIDFDLSFVKGLSFEDGCATLSKFTAFLISEGLKKISKKNNIYSKNIIFCGGGRKNTFLMNCIKKYLEDDKIIINDIDDYNFNGDFIESQAFSYLAIRSFLKLPISFPNTTRTKKEITGGDVKKNF